MRVAATARHVARVVLPLVLAVAALVAPSTAQRAAEPPRITHGIAAGDVTSTEAVIWARATRAAEMIVEYTPTVDPAVPPRRTSGVRLAAGSDFTGTVLLAGLAPETRYLYWVRLVDVSGGGEAVSETGQFHTAPPAGARRPLTLVWWGDLGGQQYCRDPERGYAIFTEMARVDPHVTIASGDSVYVDGTCPPVTSHTDHPRNAVSADPEVAVHQLVSATDPRFRTAAEVLAAYRAKWKYNLEDEAYRRFRAQTSHWYQWDDHEVINDWYPGEGRIGAIRGTPDARPISALIAPGRQTLFEFTPTRPGRIYRHLAWGALAELFVLDLRSYRDDNTLPDRPGLTLDVRLRGGERRRLAGRAKTMLGAEQREWLLRGLREAEARGVVWKIVANGDPIALPSGGYHVYAPDGAMTPLYTVRDGWAGGYRLNAQPDGAQDNPLGFETELRTVLATLEKDGVKNVVFVTTDVHHARFVRLEPDGLLAGYVFHEFIAGPASAGSAPAWTLASGLRPVELYARGKTAARPSFLNFGVLRVAADGALTVEIRGIDGRVHPDDQGRPGTLTLAPSR